MPRRKPAPTMTTTETQRSATTMPAQPPLLPRPL
jgi:hypothetical protein